MNKRGAPLPLVFLSVVLVAFSVGLRVAAEPVSSEVQVYTGLPEGSNIISGHVSLHSGAPLAGVTVSATVRLAENTFLPAIVRSNVVNRGSGSRSVIEVDHVSTRGQTAGEFVYTTKTDRNGNYTLNGLLPGQCVVEASISGLTFNPLTRTVTLPPDATGVDFTTAVGSNNPPNVPANPSPANGSGDRPLIVDLSWSGGDPDGDTVTYDVYLEAADSSPDILVSDDQSATSFEPSKLSIETHYYWQIVAQDEHGALTSGPIWDFTSGDDSPAPSEMVLVPAGEFLMGCDPDHNADIDCQYRHDELPLHAVYLDAYTIETTEVTNAQFAYFLNGRNSNDCGSNSCILLDQFAMVITLVDGEYVVEPGYEDHPAIWVTWDGATSYCVENGKRLPTEAEWEKAARGTAPRAYPWGDGTPTCALVNANNEEAPGVCVGDTTPVGSYPDGASPYGALDMSGNVSEWVKDWADDDYYDNSPYENPQGPATGTWKILRGGDYYDNAEYIRTAAKWSAPPYGGSYRKGFRCVATPSN